MSLFLVLVGMLIGCGSASDNRSPEQVWQSLSVEERIGALEVAGAGIALCPGVVAADKIYRGEQIGEASAAVAVTYLMAGCAQELGPLTAVYTMGANDPDPKVQEAVRAARAGGLGENVTAIRRALRALLFSPDPRIENSIVHWCKSANDVEACALDGSPYDSVSVTLSDKSGKDLFLLKLEELCPANSCMLRSIAFTHKGTVDTLRYSGVADDDDPRDFKP